MEKNERAKAIVKRCLTEHERVHIPSEDCDQCAMGPAAVKWKKQDKAACEEEAQAHTVSRACFERALSECGEDQDCVKAIKNWIGSEEYMVNWFKGLCDAFDRRSRP